MTITVLIAEDHTLVRDGIRSILQGSSDIEIVGEARDGAEAVRMASALLPDVVLMDIHMPGINGVEATRQIMSAKRHCNVLMLTAHDDRAYVMAAIEAGAAGYLLKSAPTDQLISGIRAVHSGETVLSMSVARSVMSGLDGVAGEDASHTLTDREIEILRLVARGLENAAIAAALSITQRTVQYHLALIFQKLAVGSRTEAVIVALKTGWLRLEQI